MHLLLAIPSNPNRIQGAFILPLYQRLFSSGYPTYWVYWLLLLGAPANEEMKARLLK